MAKAEVKRQHFIPRTYLKHFSENREDKYFIHALPIDNPIEASIKEMSTKDVGVAKDIYTLPGDTIEERMLIETFYAENYERHFDTIHALLIDPSKKQLTDEEHSLVVSTVVTMLYRTTKWINEFNEFIKRELEGLYRLCKHAGIDHFMFEGEKISIAERTIDDSFKQFKFENRPIQVISQMQIALKLIKLKSSRDGIFVIKLNDTDSEFITSDNPVVFSSVGSRHAAPFHPGNILSLPLDKKHKLMLMPFSDKTSKNMVIRSVVAGDDCFTNKLTSNFAQWEKAERFLLGSKAALNSYLHTKEATERPLSEEELRKIASLADIAKKARDLGLI